MLMGMCMMDNGKMIRLTEWDTINMLMGLHTMESGRMISSMEKEPRHGLMERGMRGATLRGRSMEKEHSASLMEVSILETFNTMRYPEKESMFGQMGSPTKDNGRRTRCTATVS